MYYCVQTSDHLDKKRRYVLLSGGRIVEWFNGTASLSLYGFKCASPSSIHGGVASALKSTELEKLNWQRFFSIRFRRKYFVLVFFHLCL